MHESAYFIVKSINGNPATSAIEDKLDTMHGVKSVSVDTKTNLISIDYDSSGISYDKIENCLNKMGYQIAADASDFHTR